MGRLASVPLDLCLELLECCHNMAATSCRAHDPRVEKAEATASLLPGLRNHVHHLCCVSVGTWTSLDYSVEGDYARLWEPEVRGRLGTILEHGCCGPNTIQNQDSTTESPCGLQESGATSALGSENVFCPLRINNSVWDFSECKFKCLFLKKCIKVVYKDDF